MRRSVVVVLSSLSLLAVPAFAAQLIQPTKLDVRKADRTGSPLANHVGSVAAETANRARPEGVASFGAPAPIPGWTITQIGDVVYMQDDGTHQCDGGLSQEWFETCMAGTDSALEAFYAQYPEANPGYVSFYLGWDIGAFFAFYSPVANDVDGIGAPKHGNPNGLNGLIFMNSVQLYSSYGPQNREFLFDMIWGQEFGHRWGSFVQFIDHNGEESDDLLGRDDSHWSYFLDTDWSWMEGNDWEDVGGGKFTTNFDTFGQPGYGYSKLDQYLMGFIPPSAVPKFFYIDEAPGDNADPPAIMYGQPDTIKGKKRWVEISQIIEAEGERTPSFRTAKRNFQVANIVILRATDVMDAAVQEDMADYNEWARTHFSRDTFELAYVETTIGTPLPNGAPTAVLELPLEAKEDGAAVTLDASKSSDPDGEKISYVWDFGDGTSEITTSPIVEHVFKDHGDLQVTVVVVDVRGRSHSAIGNVSVAAAPAKGGNGMLGGIGCSVTGTAADSVPAISTALLALAGFLGLAIRRRVA